MADHCQEMPVSFLFIHDAKGDPLGFGGQDLDLKDSSDPSESEDETWISKNLSECLCCDNTCHSLYPLGSGMGHFRGEARG